MKCKKGEGRKEAGGKNERKEGEKEGGRGEGSKKEEGGMVSILDFGKSERPLINSIFNPKWNLLCPGATPATSKAASQDEIHVLCLTGKAKGLQNLLLVALSCLVPSTGCQDPREGRLFSPALL